MSFASLLNNTCNTTRKSTDGTKNDYGELITTVGTVLTGAACRLEKVGETELIEAYLGGDTEHILYCLYMAVGSNIQFNDIVRMVTTPADFAGVTDPFLIVCGVENAGGGKGHHLEVYCKYRKAHT